MAKGQALGIASLLMLGACASGTRPATIGAPPPAAAVQGQPRDILGADAGRLIQMFGEPRLDIRERTARKLQFANGRCVLDAYLYAPARGREAVVTHVDSRLPSGVDTDPAACAATFRKR